MVGPKMQAFCPRIDMLKGNRCILRIRGAPVCQKVPKLYFQSQFSMSKIVFVFEFNDRPTDGAKHHHRFGSVCGQKVFKKATSQT